MVVLPGILGRTPRRDGRLAGAPSAGSALRAIATFGASLRRLELPAGIGDDHLLPDWEQPGLYAPREVVEPRGSQRGATCRTRRSFLFTEHGRTHLRFRHPW